MIFLTFFFNFLLSSDNIDTCHCTCKSLPPFSSGYYGDAFKSLSIKDRLHINSICMIIERSDKKNLTINTTMSTEAIIDHLDKSKRRYTHRVYTIRSFPNNYAKKVHTEMRFNAGSYLKENPNNTLLHNINTSYCIKSIYGEYNAFTSLNILNKYRKKYTKYLIGSFKIKHNIDDFTRFLSITENTENFEQYMQLAIGTAYIFNTEKYQKFFGHLIFPIGKLDPKTGEIKKIENSIEYLSDIMDKISHVSIKNIKIKDINEEDQYITYPFSSIIFYAKESESSIIKTIRQIENLKKFYIKKKEQLNNQNYIENRYLALYHIEIILKIINSYLNILSSINYIEFIEDLEKYNSGEKNIKFFHLNEEEKKNFNENSNLFSKIILLESFTKEPLINNTEYTAKLNDILSILFKNNTPEYFLANKFYGMYIKKKNNNRLDETIIPYELAWQPFSYNQKKPNSKIFLDKFDKALNELYQKESNGDISIISFNNNIKYDNLGCWGLLWPTIYAFNNKKINQKYYGYNIFPIGAINKEKSTIYNPQFSDVGAIGFKIDDVLNHINTEALENNIIILSSSHKHDIECLIDSIRRQKERLIEEKSNNYSCSLYEKNKLTKESMHEYSILIQEKKKIQIKLYNILSFFEDFLKKNINYAFDSSHLSAKIINQRYTSFSYRIIPKNIIKNYLRQIEIPYKKLNNATQFRKNLFDKYTEIKAQIDYLQKKNYSGQSTLSNFIQKISNIIWE